MCALFNGLQNVRLTSTQCALTVLFDAGQIKNKDVANKVEILLLLIYC